MSLFQSNLRKQIRNLPKILNFVKKIHYYCELFTSLLGGNRRPRARAPPRLPAAGPHASAGAGAGTTGEGRLCSGLKRQSIV